MIRYNLERFESQGADIVIKKILCVLLAAAIAFLFCGCKKISYDISEYEKLVEKNDLLPSLSQLGSYSSVSVMHYHDSGIIYNADAYTLTVEYSDGEYEGTRDGFLKNCAFESGIIKDENGEKETEFKYDGYTLKVFNFDIYELEYPHEIFMMGYSDSLNQLVFVYFEDEDLDHFDGNFADFLADNCGWN